jgi:hypothetical protein
LFIALSEDYELQFAQLMTSRTQQGENSLTRLTQSALKVMDLQFEYRCLFMFIYSAGHNQHSILNQVSAKWIHNLSGFTSMISSLIKAKILNKSILEKENFEIFKFQYINLFTTWLVSHSIYDGTLPLALCKEVYAKGVLMAFYPFVTVKGKAELRKLLRSKLH